LSPTPRKPTTFSSADGAALTGDLYLAADATSPSVVLVHRYMGDRAEWQPLIDALVRADKRYTLLAFDLRGHGSSKPPAGEKPNAPAERMTADVRAAIAHVVQATGGKTRGVVLVGSSLGAALISAVSFGEPRVTALALVSPGAAVGGVDVYRPFAEVRNLPAFIAGSTNDPVSREPLEGLAKMAMRGTVRRYSADRHSAGHLGAAEPELWKDLVGWLMDAYGEAPVERRSLYYAPGKEPPARAQLPRAKR
jgi:pimeloyl-ACP methyl ester carboxylesterase